MSTPKEYQGGGMAKPGYIENGRKNGAFVCWGNHS